MSQKIAITGTIGSGKSTVSILLRRRGISVFDADHFAKMFYNRNQSSYQEIVDLLTEEVLDERLEIDRKKVAGIVFSDEEKRLALNAIIHPRVKEGLVNFLSHHEEEDVVFAEVPLLFESEMQDLFDAVWVVTCEDETAINRLMEYREFSRSDAENRLASQIDKEKQIARGDVVIHNDGTIRELNQQVMQLVNQSRKGS